MNQQPDKLFRDKLEGYQKPAPASAWEKIAAAQTKKNDKWLWLKIAASITLLAVAGYMLLPVNNTTELTKETSTKSPEEKKTEQVPQSVEESTKELKAETTTPPVPSNNNSAHVAKKNKKIENVTPANDEGQQFPTVKENITDQEMLDVPLEVNENIASVKAVVQPEAEETAVAAQVEPQNITLVYTAKDVEEYLDKKSLAEATSDSKKSSTLKKLLKKANDLTNNQDPFGELRQKKNEILALNFKNEKQRGQNK